MELYLLKKRNYFLKLNGRNDVGKVIGVASSEEEAYQMLMRYYYEREACARYNVCRETDRVISITDKQTGQHAYVYYTIAAPGFFLTLDSE